MRLPSLLALLVLSLLTAGLVRVPLTAVPTYESGIVVAAVAAALTAAIAALRAQSRPLTAQLKWGLLDRGPVEQVLGELAAAARLGLLLVLLPIPALVSEALSSGCRAFAGLPAYLFATLPAVLVGASAGILAGSLTRRRFRAAAILGALGAACAVADVLEFLQGGRMFVHDVVLGPLSSAGVTGHDQGLGFPPSAAWHRAWAVLLALVLVALAALVRCRKDAPALPEGQSDLSPADGWRESRSGDEARARFLLRHEARAAMRGLAVLGLLALPFLAFHERAGILGGRDRLKRAMPLTATTPRFRIHYAPGSPAEAHLERLAVELEWAREQSRAWLGFDPPWIVDAWLHPDADTQWRLTGARGFVFAVPWRHEFHVSSERGRVRALRHELLHVLVADRGIWPFRVSLSMGMTEGIATALDEGFAREDAVHAQVAAAAAAGFVPPAGSLLSWTGFSGGTTDQSYRASASFVGWLMKAHGPEAILDAYCWGDVEESCGATLAELDAAWRDFLREVPVPPGQDAAGRERFDPVARPAFRRMPCSRLGAARDPEDRSRGDLLASEKLHDAAADAYCETAGWREDPEVLESAAWERVRAGRLHDALQLTEAALQRTPARATRREGLLRLRARLAVALGLPDLARQALLEWRDSGLADFPETVSLEEQGLLDEMHGEAFAVAVLSPGPDATSRLGALLSDAPDFAPAVHEQLLRLGTARPVTADRLELGLRLARLVPGPLAAQRLIELARSREEELAWSDAARLYDAALAQPGLRPLQRLESEDGHGRALWAPSVTVHAPRLRRPEGPRPDARVPDAP